VVRILLAAGANREIEGFKGTFASTSVQYAETYGKPELVRLLLNDTLTSLKRTLQRRCDLSNRKIRASAVYAKV
jgi:hypothetical protein